MCLGCPSWGACRCMPGDGLVGSTVILHAASKTQCLQYMCEAMRSVVHCVCFCIVGSSLMLANLCLDKAETPATRSFTDCDIHSHV